MEVNFSSASYNANEYYETIHLMNGLGHHASNSVGPVRVNVEGIFDPPRNPIVSHTRKAGLAMKSSANSVLRTAIVSILI